MQPAQDDFWKRMGLQVTDRTKCFAAVQERYKEYYVEQCEHQGYCSFTLLLTPREKSDNHASNDELSSEIVLHATELGKHIIIQLRPTRYALNLDMAWVASKYYPSLAPVVRGVDIWLPGDLRAYEMSKMDGVPLSSLLPKTSSSIEDGLRQKQTNLIKSLATIIARSWPESGHRKRRDSILRPDPPADEEPPFLSLCTGKVGCRIVEKLERLSHELQDNWLRERAEIALEKLRSIVDYPVVLNHGDLIPSNILVNEDTWEITGLVDWAEAELLPFGTCLYGLEHLLGTVQAKLHEEGEPTFVYYENASQLRDLLWNTLGGLVPELGSRQEEVEVMRDIGVFLWHGYAWDEGAIDRVVCEVNDGEELAKLRAFLSIRQ